MTPPPGPVDDDSVDDDSADDDFVQVDVSDEIVPAVIFESQIRSQGIRVARLDPDFEGPLHHGYRQYRLLVSRKDLPLVLEMLKELQD